ncbi:MAG: glycosyltransferase family 39 protein, partial [Proteobacteria bacterium]|nr:glycosyltransferase family 39 protein [Pseudomonadota bacterium]
MALSTASDDRAPVAIPGLVATHGRWLLAAILVVGSLYRLWVLSAADIDLFFDEAYYWDWAQQLAWGYYSKPPLLAWLIAATTAVFGDGEIAVKSGALLAYPVTTWILFLLGRRLYNESLAFYVALAFFTLPAVSLSSLVIATDVVLLLVWTAAMLFFHRAISDNRWVDWLIAGALGGVGLLAKYNFVLFLPSALLFLSVSAAHRHHLRNPKLYAAVGLAAAVFLPHILWNAAHGWPTLRHTAEISKLGGDLFHVGH